LDPRPDGIHATLQLVHCHDRPSGTSALGRRLRSWTHTKILLHAGIVYGVGRRSPKALGRHHGRRKHIGLIQALLKLGLLLLRLLLLLIAHLVELLLLWRRMLLLLLLLWLRKLV
jgi:hypothetical protein